ELRSERVDVGRVELAAFCILPGALQPTVEQIGTAPFLNGLERFISRQHPLAAACRKGNTMPVGHRRQAAIEVWPVSVRRGHGSWLSLESRHPTRCAGK